ncbi:uncharacterized protein PDZPH1 [Erinaceus europaeus]|uniref:Uncharacterized protein PDZPH1 n=1 Tax=Erinaceus europaeus TaxID=9365 RepID=A0A1S2ZZ59_ERIEU|nr:uncharacterized protein PDZPH1 [Erinaceus europaeus]
MWRKRRKFYKNWKILNPIACDSQLASQACKKNIKTLHNKVKEDTSEAVVHQTEALGKSKKNGDEHTASVNGKQNFSHFPKDKKQPPSDSKTKWKKENDNPSSISHQLEKVLSGVMLNDCKESLSGKNMPQDFPNTAETLKPVKDKVVAAMKYGAFNLQIEIQKKFFCKAEMQLPTRKRCPKCHQCYSVRCFTSGTCSSTCRNVLVELGDVPAETARSEKPSLKVSILGRAIKIKSMSQKQNIVINVAHPQKRVNVSKSKNVFFNPTIKEYVRPSVQSAVVTPEKWQGKYRQLSSHYLHVSSPAIFAVQKEVNFNTAEVPLCSASKREMNKPGTPASVLDNCEVESAVSQNFKIIQDFPPYMYLSEAETHLKNTVPTLNDTLKTTSLSDIDLRRMPFEDSKDVYRDRKISFDIPQSTTSDLYIAQSTDSFPVQDSKNSDICSLSFLSMQFLGEEAVNTGCKGIQNIPTVERCENSSSTCSPSSKNMLKSSLPLITSSQWITRPSESKANPRETLSFDHSAKVVIGYEEEQGDEKNSDINKANLHRDSSGKAQQLVEVKTAQWPTLILASSDNLPMRSPLESSNHSTMEWSQTVSQINHPETGPSSKTEELFMSLIANELEERLIIKSDKEVMADSNSATVIKNCGELPNSQENTEKGKFQLIPVVKNTYHRDFEELSSQTHNESCFQVDFPSTAEFNCAAADNLFLTEKTLTNETNQYGKQDKTNIRQASFKHEPVECQRIASTRSNPEGDDNDSKENDYHQIDILFSPQQQKDLKDWNLDINSLRKLSQELAPRGTRASDGSQEEAIEQWARRRQQFRDGKRCNSAGGSSFASNVTEGSITSDEGHSVDIGFRIDIEDKGFYTENFHSAAWVFQGDDGNPEDSPRCLSKKCGQVAVRERTVRLFKGTGDYPWGFRIQFSKPIVVTEVDANSAAEEAGLQIGDVVLAVNGTEVTSVEHAEAVHLARKGPDILTLMVGSDISRCPNTPWPTCRGYLHKRTHSGFLKGWRKRWFVLKHDGCLHYYRHKKDEGKCSPLEAIKLEGAEVGVDNSLGKPFVFNCVPQSGNRTFCLCATSSQDMKRWLEAMEKAAHPVHQNHVWEDVTLHNSNLPPLAIKNPECLGLLHQLDRNKETWVQHYCILKDGCLYFYASIRSTQASGGLYLQGYRVSEQMLSFKQSVIELKPSSEELKTFYFCAEDKTENQRWITALKVSIKKWLPLHQAIQDFMSRPIEETRM